MEILDKTQSICPQCHKPVDAFYIRESDNSVIFIKTCPEHGEYRAFVADNAEDYIGWTENVVINVPPQNAITQGDPQDKGCPLYCGTCQNHLQTACCVLIDITKRCNQHCSYCFAEASDESCGDRGGGCHDGDGRNGGDVSDGVDPLTLEDIGRKYDLLLELGEERPFNIQLSGGEPTVRDDLPEIINLAVEKGFEYIQINSNGRRIAQEEGYATKLKDAGASVIFMQFDGMNDEIYMKLRGEPLLEIKKKAVENCRKAGLAVTLVPTVVAGVNLDNIGEMMDYMVQNVDIIKGIHFQPVSFFGRHPDDFRNPKGRVTMFDVLHQLEAQRPEFSFEDYLPISTGHSLCCFYSTYTREPDGSIRCGISRGNKSPVSCCEASDLEIIRRDRDYVLNKWDVPETSGSSAPCSSCSGDTGSAQDTEPQQSTGCCCEAGSSGGSADANCSNRDISTHIEATQQQNIDCRKEPGSLGPADTDCFSGADSNPPHTDTDCCSDYIMDMDEFLAYYRSNTFTVTGMAFQDITNLDAERLKRCRVQVLSQDDRLIPFCAYNTIYRGEYV